MEVKLYNQTFLAAINRVSVQARTQDLLLVCTRLSYLSLQDKEMRKCALQKYVTKWQLS